MSERAPIQPLPTRVTHQEFFAGLEHMLGRSAPFLTCYLPIETAQDIVVSRAAIESAGLTADDRDFAASLLDGAESNEDEHAMVAAIRAGDGTIYLQHYPEAPIHPVVERTHVPRLGPMIEAEQRLRHHLLVVTSDAGIDVMTFPRHGTPTTHTADEQDAERRIRLIKAAVEQTETRLVIITGVADMANELARRLRLEVPIETIVEALITEPSDDRRAEAVVQAVANDHAAATVGALREWRFERSHGDAVADVVETVEALRTGEARLLLLHDDPDDARQLWVGAHGRTLAVDLEDASLAGGMHITDTDITDTDIDAFDGELFPVRLTDALLRSAILQGIPVRMMPALPDATMPGGIGVLREPDFDQRHAYARPA